MLLRGVVTVAALGMFVGGSVACRGDSKTSPTVTAALEGPWTGTLSRPNGLAPIAVRWEATQKETNGVRELTGPMTLTIGAVSVTFSISAVLAGNNDSGFSVHVILTAPAGSIATLPNCAIFTGASESVDSTSRLKAPFSAGATISTNGFTLRYSNCQGFMEPDPPSTSRIEATQLNLTKQ
jgi:hypothetical protein